MVFNSYEFLLFFLPLKVGGYYLLNVSHQTGLLFLEK